MLALLAVLALTFAVVPAASANESTEGRHQRSVSWDSVSWWWDDDSTIGGSLMIRGNDAIRAGVYSRSLTPGDVATLWFIVFNNPEACSTDPCSVPADVFNPDAEADFHWGAGAVVNAWGRVWLRGSLNVGETAHSGKAETGLADAEALSNPHGAEVVLAIHSHGPALTGADLDAQLSSFTGGCAVFNGPDGFASGPQDIPDEVGECSTLTHSLHRVGR